jgi:hypothetical protein
MLAILCWRTDFRPWAVQTGPLSSLSRLFFYITYYAPLSSAELWPALDAIFVCTDTALVYSHWFGIGT